MIINTTTCVNAYDLSPPPDSPGIVVPPGQWPPELIQLFLIQWPLHITAFVERTIVFSVIYSSSSLAQATTTAVSLLVLIL